MTFSTPYNWSVYFVNHTSCHDSGGWGTVGNGEEEYQTVSYWNNYGYYMRLQQHEMSHGFGALDNACYPNSVCIMNGGFDGEGTSIRTGVLWCWNCQAKMVNNINNFR